MIIVRTPLRVSFFGGGTDHPDWFENSGQGAVLSTSINKYVYIQLRRIPNVFDFNYRVCWREVEQVKTVNEIKHPVVQAVLRHYGEAGDPGFEVVYNADLPARSGLGSSSAFTVALLQAFLTERGRSISSRELAQQAIFVEQDLLKEPVGCQDQIAVAMGGLNRIDFHTRRDFSMTPICAPEGRRQDLSDHLMMFFTGFTRSASNIEAEKKKNFAQKSAELNRMYEMVREGQDILQSQNANLVEFGQLLHEAWMAKRALASSVSSSEIDEVYQAAIDAGAVGGKLLGAGGGGFLLFFVPPEKRNAVRQKLHKLVHVPISMSREGTRVILFDPDLSRNYETTPLVTT
ncbi:MAG TPA: kinase [Asticcacaulis sp.]|nr:kinase [Asticcacaulis sp.]